MNRILLLIGLITICSTAIGQTKNFIDQPYVETTAKVDTLVTPDRIYLSILISESDTKGRQTVEELEQLMANKLTDIGIELNNQLVLSDLSSNFKKYFLRKQDILKAKSYELKVYDAKTAGRVIYELEGIGISNVDLERTEYSKIEELKLELKSKAVQKAKLQAEAMIKPLNQEIGNAIFISDLQTNIINALQGRVAGIQIYEYSKAKQEYESISVEFEKIKIESKAEVKFEIEKN
jgi:uncharacterized protein YggE